MILRQFHYTGRLAASCLPGCSGKSAGTVVDDPAGDAARRDLAFSCRIGACAAEFMQMADKRPPAFMQ
jgi:hypothetical protein